MTKDQEAKLLALLPSDGEVRKAIHGDQVEVDTGTSQVPGSTEPASIVTEDAAGIETGKIPFTQYVLPHGRKRREYIGRPVEIAQIAHRFIEGGGWYECEILSTGHVSLTACMIVDEEPQDVEIAICQNGPAVLDTVDKIVRASVAHLSKAEK